jgi:hypothetical protein
MKPFRTNKKDRALFAKALGLEDDGGMQRSRTGEGVLYNKYGTQGWQFFDNGFEYCLQECLKNNEPIDPRFFHSDGEFFCEFFDMDRGITVVDKDGDSIGEAFFRAVVQLEADR